MPNRDNDKAFQSIAHALYEADPIDPILAAAEHPLMVRASRFIMFRELSEQIDDTDYIEMLALLRWEFDLNPDEVCTAMEICEERIDHDQA